MSQEFHSRSRRTARARRHRPALVTEQELEQQQVEEHSTIATESAISSTADATEPQEVAKPRRRLAGFFSIVGKNDKPAEKKEEDVARARLARATRGKVTEDKATIKSSETPSKDTKEVKPASSGKAPQRPQSAFKTRYILGMFIYLIAANFIGLYETQFMRSIGADYELTQIFGLQIRTSTLAFLATLVIILVILAKLDFLPTSLMGKSAQDRARQAKSQSQNTASSPKAPQPTVRQGVKGADDALYQQYRQVQRKKK